MKLNLNRIALIPLTALAVANFGERRYLMGAAWALLAAGNILFYWRRKT